MLREFDHNQANICVYCCFSLLLLYWLKLEKSRGFWIIYGWTVFYPPMKTFSFLFSRTFVFIHVIFNFFFLIYNAYLACCPSFSFSQSGLLRQQTKSYKLSPCVWFRTHCNTAFWSVKLILHDEKNQMRKDLLVLYVFFDWTNDSEYKRIFLWKISNGVLSKKHPKIQFYCWFWAKLAEKH